MRATGIVRRIDDLGRIVVPKEIRRVMRIREGDPLEIFTGKDGEIVLKKYSPMGELSLFAQQYVDSISQSLNLPVAVADKDMIIAVAGMPKRELVGKSIHKELEDVINDRQAVLAKKGDTKFINITVDDEEYEGEVVQTIISEGDAIGAVIVLNKDVKKNIGEIEQKVAVIAANFLGKQMEG
ncbi:MAG: stage V sporulation protein T [Coprococcus sp.]